jgi:hypothetical protein
MVQIYAGNAQGLIMADVAANQVLCNTCTDKMQTVHAVTLLTVQTFIQIIYKIHSIHMHDKS